MTTREREIVAGWLNRLPFVRWDRFVDGDTFEVFGWIDRTDGRRSAFIVLNFGSIETVEQYTEMGAFSPGFTTSSAERSLEINQLLYGADNDWHVPCQRVEDVFGDLVANSVHLAAPVSAAVPSPARRAEPSDA